MKKKLIYIAPLRTVFPSTCASSLHMVKMCEAYSSFGYDVILIVGTKAESDTRLFEYYNVKNKFSIKHIAALESKLGNITYAVKSALYTSRKKSYYIVGRSVTALSMLAIWGKDVTIDMHGPATDMHKVDQFLFKLANKKSSLKKISLNSIALKNIMEKISYIDSSKLVVAHNGSDEFLDYQYSDLKSIFEFSKEKLDIGYFGSLYAGRGMDLIINLANNTNGVAFHIFGGTDPEIKFWKEKCQTNNVYFYGHVSYRETFFYRNMCDALIAPYNPKGVSVSSDSKGDSSAYMNPIKLIEYLSAGKPVLTSKIDVLKEVLNESHAFFCEYDELSEWQEALEKLNDAELTNKMGANALRKFNEGFTWKVRARKLL